MSRENQVDLEVAVIGMAGRFPGANSVSDVTHRIIAWATTTSHTTPMAAHTVTAPLRTGVDATASDVRRSLLISTVAASPLATFFDE